MDLIEDVVEDMQKNGEPVPEPLALKNFSGKFMLRTTPEMHRRLAIEAAEQKISLSRLVNSKLASSSHGSSHC
ncbi:toxin-antitoxin system HicB family antitoxin [Marinobacterium aestuariivivens]|uniref:Toxin-antitoxin system HicB family antitoxin n=1 Tax=Marinobacterium aestuariivivens TaxID=1698799 RepID=A0ABW2A9M0_9GAMM